MTSSPRLLVIADVGGEERRHVGDEAMLEANLAAFRRLVPEVAFTVVSHDPAWTAARYGVDTVAPLGFPRDPVAGAEREAMLDRVLTDAAGRRKEDATIDAVARADGLVVSGGGNLSSTWPDLLYERAALMHLARIFEKPAVVLGQTLGPRLGDDERRLLAETLTWARFVGLRELPSAALALELRVPPERIWYQCDDALSLEEVPAPVSGSDRSGAPAIAVTIDPQVRAAGEAVFGPLVRQLRELSESTGAPLILIPHVFGNESEALPSDLTEARVLAERLGLSHTVIAAGLDARQARQVTGDSVLVISSRYHPLVFGLAAGTPSIGIYGDEYCRIKLQGALAHARLERWTLTYEDVVRGRLLPNALELWHARGEVRRELESRREAWREEARRRWAAVLRALDPAMTIPPVESSTMFGRPIEDVAPALVSALEARRKAWEWERASFERYARPLQPEMGLRRTLRRSVSVLRAKLRHIGLGRQ
jgi:polysaccharide pyruvyl transferase WcaK-like protein